MRSFRPLVVLVAAAALLAPFVVSLVRPAHTTSAQTTPTITVTPNTFQAGSVTSVDVAGSGFGASETVDVVCNFQNQSATFVDQPVTTTAGADGTLPATAMPVPSDVAPGTYQCTASGETTNSPVSADVLVLQADTPTPTDTPTVTPTSTATPIPSPTATSSVSSLPPPPPPPNTQPTATPTFTPTATATETPTPTATPTETPTSTPLPPIVYSVVAVKVGFGSSDPAKLFKKSSLKRTTPGKRLKLVIYAKFSDIVVSSSISLGFRVTRGSKTVYLDKPDETVTPDENGKRLEWDEVFSTRTKGAYRFHGTVFVAGTHKHKTAAFSVVAG